jgi:signal transduction histidine kinase
MNAPAARGSVPIADYLARMLRVLPLRGVALVADGGVLLGAVGEVGDLPPERRPSGRDDALDTPVVPERHPPMSVATVGVHVEAVRVATLDLWADVDWRPDAWESVAARMLARGAGLLVDGDGRAVERVTEEMILLRGAQSLVDLGSVSRTDQLLGGIAATIAPLVEAAAVGIAVVNHQGYLQMLSGSFGASDSLVASSQLSREEPNSAAAEVFNTGQPLLANTPSKDASRFPEWIEGYGIDRLMTLPLRTAGRTIGVLHVANKDTDFTPADAVRAGQLAPFVAGLVKQARQRRDIGRKEAVAAVVGRAATAVAAGERLDIGAHTEGLDYFLDGLRRVLGARTAAVVPAGEVTPSLLVGEPLDEHPACRAFADGMGGSVAVRSSVRRPRTPREAGWTTLYVPIAVEGRVESLLALLRVPCEPFRKHERAAVIQMSNLISLSWTTELYRERQAEIARLRERERIADDIHDHVAQTIFSGKITLESLVDHIPPGSSLRGEADRALGMLVRSERSIREAIRGLAAEPGPGPAFGDRLVDAVHEVEEQFMAEVGLMADDEVLRAADRLSGDVATAVVGAVREAVVNALKHARASRIDVTLARSGDRLTASVRDDGRGMSASPEGYGRRAMERRLAASGASLQVREPVAGGTEVVIGVPLGVGE